MTSLGGLGRDIKGSPERKTSWVVFWRGGGPGKRTLRRWRAQAYTPGLLEFFPWADPDPEEAGSVEGSRGLSVPNLQDTKSIWKWGEKYIGNLGSDICTISLKMEEHVSNTVDLINIFPALPSSLTFTPGALPNVARGGMSKFNVCCL